MGETRSNWLKAALLIGLGGCVYVVATLTGAQMLAESWENGRLMGAGQTKGPGGLAGLIWSIVSWAWEVDTDLAFYVVILGGWGLWWCFAQLNKEAREGNTMAYLFIGGFVLLIALSFAGTGLTSHLLSMSAVALVAFFALSMAAIEPPAALAVVGVWSAGYVCLWLLGEATSGVSLPLYLGFWLLAGAGLGPMMISTGEKPVAALARAGSGRGPARAPGARPGATSGGVQRAAAVTAGSSRFSTAGQKSVRPAVTGQEQDRPTRGGRAALPGTRSEFGRVSQDTVSLLTQQVRRVNGPVASGLPLGAPEGVRQWTVKAVLDRTVRDWWFYDNMSALEPKDVEDLRSFIEAAGHLSTVDSKPEGQAVYRAVLGVLLDDWLENWNADGVDGPPRRD